MAKSQIDVYYRGFTLDPFQQEAIGHINRYESVVVAAPTGVGKTLIADYLIETTYAAGGRVIYTAPIKALSNQKFKEFKALMGPDVVGILTGDVVVNPDAKVLIMTTEIFRNLLQDSSERVADVRYVIFDEIHYIDDPERGSVWEESLIFMPDTMRFLGLSATIPNFTQLAAWIGSIHNRPIQVVTHFDRVVPLVHRLFERSMGAVTVNTFRKRYKRLQSRLQEQQQLQKERIPATSHLDLIAHLRDDYLPCLFFTFSRRKAEANALELGQGSDFLNREEKRQVETVIQSVAHRYPQIASNRWTALRRLVLRGIGYHHAGMLPALKDVVEELFTHRLLRVLYCTETFAVGLNFPCKTVCFDSSSKWDGVSFRPISNREYFQMAGRAGRRGIDTEGYVFTVVDLNYYDPAEFPSMKEDQIEPLQSQFSLTYNSILNLTRNYDAENIKRILGLNFASYQAEDQLKDVRTELTKVQGELERFCADMDVNNCPLVYQRLQRKIQQYQHNLAREHSRQRKQRFKQKIASIQGQLAKVVVRDCPSDRQRACRSKGALYRKLVSGQRRLRKREQRIDPKQKYLQEFADKQAVLVALGHLEGDILTTGGEFAAQIHGQELLVTELYLEGLFHQYKPAELNALVVSIGYEPRKNETKMRHPIDFSPVHKIIYHLSAVEDRFLGYSTLQFSDHIAQLVYRWTNGEAFSSLVQDASIDEGDIVFAFRRGIDLLRQVRNATSADKYLNNKLRECMARMDRDEISIWL